MANSKLPGPAGTHHHRRHGHGIQVLHRHIPPAHTPGPLGHNDQGDPTRTTLLGWTPNVTGWRDWGDPTLHRIEDWGRKALGSIGLDAGSGLPLSLGSSSLAPAQAAGDLDWETLKSDYVRWEGKVPYMYLDTRSLVTVGIGKMLPNVAAAQQLPFVRRSDKKAASADEIKTDFENVKKQPGSQLFVQYKRFTALDLPDDEIFKLLKSVNDTVQQQLRENLTGYDAFPVAARRALTDMTYNLGIGGLMNYHHMIQSINARDWKKAAAECHRNGPSDERNEWTKNMFLEAAK